MAQAEPRVSVVTGASGGIGRWIAKGLAQAGHHVILAGRDQVRTSQASTWIAGEVPGASLQVELADLSLLAETRRLGVQIAAGHPRVHLLVNNAGTFSARRRETSEGHEQVIALNHLCPFVLTETLLPALQHAASTCGSARIVNVGSDMSDRARIDPEDLEGRRRWGMVHAYGQSKLALMIATFGWATRLQGTGIVANVVHPGAVATGLVRTRGPIGLAWRAMAPFLLTEEQGAETPLQVALDDTFARTTGAYIKRRQAAKPNRRALNPALAQRVWDATKTLSAAAPDTA